jgi:PPOX class probable F420-dependent enzyme
MSTKIIPDEYLDLFEKRAFGHLVTLMPDGSPQVTPVWVDYDGTYVLVNSALGRQKDRNMRRDGRVALEIGGHRWPGSEVLGAGYISAPGTGRGAGLVQDRAKARPRSGLDRATLIPQRRLWQPPASSFGFYRPKW